MILCSLEADRFRLVLLLLQIRSFGDHRALLRTNLKSEIWNLKFEI
jgi:hypothetical protein